MEIHFQISFRKIVLTRRFNDWIIFCDLTKFHHFMSIYVLYKLRSFNVRRRFLGDILSARVLEKYFLQKCDGNTINQ